MSQYDVVVIGSGPGGYVAAIHAAQQGLKTAIVEREPSARLGGTCLLRGCIPTKAMLQSADLLYDMRRSEQFGVVRGAEPKIDIDAVSKYRDSVVAKSANGVKYLMKKNAIDVYLGHGRLAARQQVSVTGADGKVQTLKTKFAIVATGSVVRDLPFLPPDHERIITSDDLLAKNLMPESLIVLGAGAVGCEFASVYLRYGAKVTLIEALDHILPIEDTEVSVEAKRAFEKGGMKVLTGAKLSSAKVEGDRVKAIVQSAKGEQTLEASHLLVAIGRRPVTEDVGLKGTKVKLDERGYIDVSPMMQTGEGWVYAIGDVVNTPWLAHVASKEGILAVDHLRGANPRPLHYERVPNCTYCMPEVASVGLTEREARARGHEVKVGKFPFSAIAKASIVGKPEGFVKLIADAKHDELLGAHIIGPKATELITELTLALEQECTLEELAHTIHPHPTLAEAVGEAAHAALGHPIHI